MPGPSLTFPMQLPPQVRKELEAFLAQLNEGYLYVEHNEDGTHSDITAESITADFISGDVVTALSFFESERETAAGHWAVYTYAASNFAGSGSMTWSVDDAGELFSYSRVGSTLFIHGIAANTNVGGTAGLSLRLTLPLGLVGAANAVQRGPILYQDAMGGDYIYGYWQVGGGNTWIDFFKLDSLAWTLTVGNNTTVNLMNTIIQVDPA